jgi:mannose-6-phosphate isomerase-like protein (cupin superfamily)
MAHWAAPAARAQGQSETLVTRSGVPYAWPTVEGGPPTMLDVGSHITNPRTGTEFRVMELGETRFVMRYTIPAGVGVPDIAEHYHHGWTEEFHVLEGHGHYRLDGRQHDIGAGESVTLPERVKHVHPWSSGDVQMVYDQIGTVENPSPNAVRETFGFFFTMFDWESQGKIKLDKVGLPKNPILFALAGRVLGRAGGYDARIPRAVADFGGATFGRLAEGLGYQIIDPKWR